MNYEKSPTFVEKIIKNLDKSDTGIRAKISDEVRAALKSPLFADLNLTEIEIKKNIYAIYKIIEDQKKCDLFEKTCFSSTAHHLTLERGANNNLYLVAVPCKKMQALNAKNSYRKNFLIKHFSDEMLDLELSCEYFDLISPTKNLIVNKFNKMVSKKIPLAGFYIYGDMGVGKTYSAIAFANELAKKNYTIAFVFVPEIVYTLKNGFSNSEFNSNDKIVEKLKSADVLFLDDMGAEEANIWFYNEYLLLVLNHRMNHNFPTFFISNLSINELEDKLLSKNNTAVNVKRLMERIKTLTKNKQFKIDGKNYRY